MVFFFFSLTMARAKRKVRSERPTEELRPPNVPTVELRWTTPNGDVYGIHANREDPIETFLNGLSMVSGFPRDSIRIMYHNEFVPLDRTPNDLDMHDGDLITVVCGETE